MNSLFLILKSRPKLTIPSDFLSAAVGIQITSLMYYFISKKTNWRKQNFDGTISSGWLIHMDVLWDLMSIRQILNIFIYKRQNDGVKVQQIVWQSGCKKRCCVGMLVLMWRWNTSRHWISRFHTSEMKLNTDFFIDTRSLLNSGVGSKAAVRSVSDVWSDWSQY